METLNAKAALHLKEQELASAEELQKNTDLELERLRKLLSEAEAAASVNADGVSDRDADIEALSLSLRSTAEAGHLTGTKTIRGTQQHYLCTASS